MLREAKKLVTERFLLTLSYIIVSQTLLTNIISHLKRLYSLVGSRGLLTRLSGEVNSGFLKFSKHGTIIIREEIDEEFIGKTKDSMCMSLKLN